MSAGLMEVRAGAGASMAFFPNNGVELMRLISGGFVRPVLELAGLKNVYTKIIGSNNKTSGVQAVFEALKQHTK
jgi:ribosomal protein S5